MRKKIALITIIIFIICITFFELFFRIIYKEQLTKQIKSTLFTTDSLFGYIPLPNTQDLFKIPGYEKIIKHNSQTFSARDFQTVKKKGILRVALVGSSNETGDFSLVGAYSDLCNDILKNKGYNVEIINCSYGGGNKDYAKIIYIRNVIKKFNPDIVLLKIFLPITVSKNEKLNYRGYIIDYEYQNRYSKAFAMKVIDECEDNIILKNLSDYCYVFRAYCKYITDSKFSRQKTFYEYVCIAYHTNRCTSKDQISYVISQENTFKLLLNTKNKLDSLKCKFFLFDYFKNEDIGTTLKEENIPYFNLNMEYSDSLTSEYDGHLNSFFHQKVAIILSEKIENLFLK